MRFYTQQLQHYCGIDLHARVRREASQCLPDTVRRAEEMALGQPAYRMPKGYGTIACWQSGNGRNRPKPGPARPAPQGES
jgi:hypothetical protein